MLSLDEQHGNGHQYHRYIFNNSDLGHWEVEYRSQTGALDFPIV